MLMSRTDEDEMPQAISKKAEHIKAEADKLEHFAKRKVNSIEKSEKTEEENRKKEVHQIGLELEKFKRKTAEDVANGIVQNDDGWCQQAIQIGEMMKQLIEREARGQHNLLLKTDEVTRELEMKVANLRKELPMVSDFSEEDRIQMVMGIEKFIKKLKEKREIIAAVEAKLNRQIQVMTECAPVSTEDKQTIMSKLQMSYDLLSGANDPDRARDDLLKMLRSSINLTDEPSTKKASPSPANQKRQNSGVLNTPGAPKTNRDSLQRSNPRTEMSQSRISTPSIPMGSSSTLQTPSGGSKRKAEMPPPGPSSTPHPQHPSKPKH